MVGSFNGALASKRVTEALINVGLDRMETGPDVQRQKPASLQDLQVAQMRKQNLVTRPYFIERWETSAKSYSGDNRLVLSERPQRRQCSAPRCRLKLG